MLLEEAIAIGLQQAIATPTLEWIAILAAIIEVLLARANQVWLYPAGIISTGIYTYLFLRPTTGLYADALLNMYYFIMSIYGWVLWQKRIKGLALPITRANKQEWLSIIFYALAGWVLLYVLLVVAFPYLFVGYKPSEVVVWDALISATAWVGMWLLARRKLENWLLLNVSNLVAIPIYWYKAMPMTAALTLFLFIVAITGYIKWRKLLPKEAI
jgi:nicotinamide mononucleotide transporter